MGKGAGLILSSSALSSNPLPLGRWQQYLHTQRKGKGTEGPCQRYCHKLSIRAPWAWQARTGVSCSVGSEMLPVRWAPQMLLTWICSGTSGGVRFLTQPLSHLQSLRRASCCGLLSPPRAWLGQDLEGPQADAHTEPGLPQALPSPIDVLTTSQTPLSDTPKPKRHNHPVISDGATGHPNWTSKESGQEPGCLADGLPADYPSIVAAKREAGAWTAGMALGKVVGISPPPPTPQMQEGSRSTREKWEGRQGDRLGTWSGSHVVSAEAKTKGHPILTSHYTVNYNTLKCLFRWVCYAWLNLKICLVHHFTLNNLCV